MRAPWQRERGVVQEKGRKYAAGREQEREETHSQL